MSVTSSRSSHLTVMEGLSVLKTPKLSLPLQFVVDIWLWMKVQKRFTDRSPSRKETLTRNWRNR